MSGHVAGLHCIHLGSSGLSRKEGKDACSSSHVEDNLHVCGREGTGMEQRGVTHTLSLVMAATIAALVSWQLFNAQCDVTG